MDEGIFKTRRTGLVGGLRVDVQWWWAAMERAEKMEKASSPQSRHQDNGVSDRQMRLPMMEKLKGK